MKIAEPKPTAREYLGAFAWWLTLGASLVIAGVGVILLFALIYFVADGLDNLVLKLATLAGPRALYVTFGVPMVLFAAWALGRVVTGRSAPLTRDEKLNRTALLVGIGGLGAALSIAGAFGE